MTQFNLFDTIKITEPISLLNGDIAPVDTRGIIVEIYNNGEAYDVELLGHWVKYNQAGEMIASDPNQPDAFVESIGVETLYSSQFVLVRPASETVDIRARLYALLDELSDDKLKQVKDFAESLRS